jgi:hypothetical protein
MKSKINPLLLLLIGIACTPLKHTAIQERPVYLRGYDQLSATDRVLADSMLALALDQEAIYTILGRIKPVSSIGFSFKYPLARDSSQVAGTHEVVDLQPDSIRQFLDEIEQWHRITNRLSSEELVFMLLPFRKTYGEDRYLQLLVCRPDLMDSTIAAHQSFFAQWGFTPETDPRTLITALEFEEMADRYRAYGYLFGYPKYAVDFFVEAHQHQEQGGEFVKRDFFHIPVFEREQGRFTYAIPKGHQPDQIDSLIYSRSLQILNKYKTNRECYVKENKFDLANFLKDWYAQQEIESQK